MERILEAIFSKHLQEDVSKCHIFDRKIGMNVLLCGNYLEDFFQVSRVGCSDKCSPRCSYLLCTKKCRDPVLDTCDISTYLNSDPKNPPAWVNFKSHSRDALISFDMNSGIRGNSSHKSECARLENAKYLSDLTLLYLLAEEASLKAEIDFLKGCTEAQPSELEEAFIQEVDGKLDVQCDQLRKMCFNSIKELACNDTLEASRLMFEYRKAYQTAHLDVRDRQIMEVRLNCLKLEIFRDIMDLEASALAELTQCLDKIHAALRKYLDITTDVKARFKLKNEAEGEENVCVTSPSSNTIDSELREVLISLFGCSPGNLGGSDDELNSLLLSRLDKRVSALDSKSASSLFTLKEFVRMAHEVFDLLTKAIHQLEWCEDDENHLSRALTIPSSSVYWNELSPFTGVFPRRLIDRLLQVRKSLDDAAVALQNLEISYELHYDGS